MMSVVDLKESLEHHDVHRDLLLIAMTLVMLLCL